MLSQTTVRPWNYYSEVRTCATCDGLGVIHDSRIRPSVWNPYPEMACPDCEGEHGPTCDVCGFTVPVAGYDCLVCETVASLTDKDCSALDSAALAAAIMRAVAQRRRAA